MLFLIFITGSIYSVKTERNRKVYFAFVTVRFDDAFRFWTLFEATTEQQYVPLHCLIGQAGTVILLYCLQLDPWLVR